MSADDGLHDELPKGSALNAVNTEGYRNDEFIAILIIAMFFQQFKDNYWVGKGFRRVVAAPKPIDIVEIEAIRALAAADQVVIACGGGGIPVIEQKHALKGASAVIEKDAIAGKLASDLSCDELIILTSVPCVYKNYSKEDQTALETLTVAEAKILMAEGQFEEGTMLPKIEAAIAYLEKVPAGKVLITSMDHVKDAIRGKAGTVITA